MVPGWDMGMGMGFEMGIGLEFEASLSAAAAAPTPATNAPAAYLFGLPPPDTLRVDDLLDFSNQELFPSSSSAATAGTHRLHPPPPANSAAAGSWPFASGDIHSSSDHHRTHNSGSFTDDLYVPCEEAAELEWLSKFVEDSFSDVPYPSSAAGHHPAPSADSNLQTDPSSIPGRGARSKRSRAASTTVHHHSHLATTWSSLVPAPPSSSPTSTASSSSSSEFPSPRPAGSSKASRRKGGGEAEPETGLRRCTHCLSERTPQWRTGPLGPKTLCNACGVRYKSGRLVPEYRPASSPTFVLTQHSNSHRKVMELRRQKEVVLLRHDSHSAPNAAARADMLFQDYDVC